MRLKDKVAIVTGAGSGFGEAMAKLFAQHGASVAVADIRKDAADRVTSEITTSGGEAVAVAVDVTSGQKVEAMVQATLERFGKLDIIVEATIDPKSHQGPIKVSAKASNGTTSVMGIYTLAQAKYDSLQKSLAAAGLL